MQAFTILVGLILCGLGVGSYFGTGRTSVTALIPAFFGLPILIAGVIALKPAARKHAMHAVAVLALLGFIGSAARAIPALFKADGEISTAIYMQLAMAVLCLILEIACVRSFINARRNRQI